MFDLISIGDARIDNYTKIEDAHIACTLNKESCEICLKFGSKIPVTEFFPITGGNNMNNSIGSSRLGLKSAIYCNVGDDPNAHLVINELKKEGVSTRYVTQNKGMVTEVSTVIHYQGERTILVFHQPWKYSLPDFDRSRWVYFSSCSYSFTENNFPKQIEGFIERTGSKLVFAPGTYQLKYRIKKLPGLLSLTNILIVNKEEAKKILEINEEKHIEIKVLLKKLLELGPKNIIITDGEEGSFAYDGSEYYQLKTFPAKLVEMTGAGDAYSTGLVAGLFYNQTLPEAMRWGAANGASVVEYVGPHKGLLTYDQMQKKLKEHDKIKTRELK